MSTCQSHAQVECKSRQQSIGQKLGSRFGQSGFSMPRSPQILVSFDVSTALKIGPVSLIPVVLSLVADSAPYPSQSFHPRFVPRCSLSQISYASFRVALTIGCLESSTWSSRGSFGSLLQFMVRNRYCEKPSAYLVLHRFSWGTIGFKP